jgi:hypothetical protein
MLLLLSIDGLERRRIGEGPCPAAASALHAKLAADQRWAGSVVTAFGGRINTPKRSCVRESGITAGESFKVSTVSCCFVEGPDAHRASHADTW